MKGVHLAEVNCVESCLGHCRSDHKKTVNIVNGLLRPRAEPEDENGKD